MLFLAFVNNLPATVQHSTIDMYVDDTTLSKSEQ